MRVYIIRPELAKGNPKEGMIHSRGFGKVSLKG